MKLLLSTEVLAFNLFEGRAADKDLEECHTEGPNVRFATIVQVSCGPFGRQIL